MPYLPSRADRKASAIGARGQAAPARLDRANQKGARRIHFNLDGLDIQRAILDGVNKGWNVENLTNKEFIEATTNRDIVSKTTYYRGGTSIEPIAEPAAAGGGGGAAGVGDMIDKSALLR